MRRPNLTGVNAGLVILVGDDPGAVLSQNEQDSRPLVDLLRLRAIGGVRPPGRREVHEELLCLEGICEVGREGIEAAEGVRQGAVCGDSSFPHVGVNGLINLASNRVGIFILILENGVAAMSGGQPHPGTGRDMRGREAPALDIAEIARACRVPRVEVVDPDDRASMRTAFERTLRSDELSVVIARKPCPLARLTRSG